MSRFTARLRLRAFGHLALIAVALVLAALPGRGQAPQDPLVLVSRIEGTIAPPTTRHIESVLARAAERDAALVVLELDTPGGLVTSTRDINRAILAAPVPVAVYVAPSGARAASAGTFIAYAAHVAAMAPGTNIGAATPISMGGNPAPNAEDGETEDPAAAKSMNDAVASIRSLAELRGRNADWAEAAVRDAASIGAEEAAERDVVDFVAADLSELLAQADGRTVSVAGETRALSLSDAEIERADPSWITTVLSVLANPNVALLLMTLGFYGLVFELANPGLGPGIVGAVLLMLGLYSLNMMPVNYAGIGLIALGLALMAGEALSPSFGILGLGGLAAFLIGAAILMDTDAPEFQLSWGVVGTLGALSLAVLVLLLGAVAGTRRQPARASSGVMTGTTARILTWDAGHGQVLAHGERWSARGPDDLSPGQEVEIEEVEGLTLRLRGASKRKDTP